MSTCGYAVRGMARCASVPLGRYSIARAATARGIPSSKLSPLFSPKNFPDFHSNGRLLRVQQLYSSALLRSQKEKLAEEVTSSSPKTGVPLQSKVLSQYEPEKLSEDILTIPNVLTILRLASTPVLGYLILIDEMTYALGLLAVSGFTDVLDGWLARRFKSATVFGSIADPAADKALMTVMVGALAWRGLIPVPLVLIIIGRDVALIISAFLIRYRSLPEPKTFARYWDPRLPSAKVQPTQISKYNTFLQIILVAGCTLIASLNDNWMKWWEERQGFWDNDKALKRGDAQGDWGDIAKSGWQAFMLLVSATTLWSGGSYLFGGGVKYMSQKMAQKGQAQVLKRR